MKKEIIVFTQENCVHCDSLKKEFAKRNIEFIEKKSKENREEWIEISKLTGVGIFPTVIVGDEYLVPGRDYANQEGLITYLGLVDKLNDNFSHELKMKENFKTLIYFINQGFSKLFKEIEMLKKEKDEHKSTD